MSSRVVDHVWRVVYRLGYPLARMWWGLTNPRHEGALVAVYVGPDVLLLRSSYRFEWNFPGGGVRDGETPEAAARRELAEETGVSAGLLLPAGVISGRWDGRRDRVHFFELRLAALPPLRFDGREIVGGRLMSVAEANAVALTGPVAAYLDGAGRGTIR